MKRKTIGIIAAAGAISVLAAACSSGGGSGGSGGAGNSTGVTKTSILIGSTQPLTGIAAPGYSEIAPASNAYFKYVNAHGGVNGRQINYKYLDDAYDPSKTVADTHQLILQDKVFAIFNALGTPTHEQVVKFINSEKVPDLFVASGCRCWDMPSTQPETFGWQPDYLIEGKILGAYIKKTFPGQKIAFFGQNDDFGHDGLQGIQAELPSSDIATTQFYDPTNTNVAPLVQKLQSSGAKIVVSFSVPAFTALLQLAALQLHFQPAHLVVSNVGSDPLTLSGLLTSFSKGKAPGTQLIQGIITDSYLASPADPSNSWIQLFQKVRKEYDPTAKALDGNVEYGMAAAYTLVQALKAAGPNLTREDLISAIEKSHWTGPGLTPFRFSTSSHAGYTGVQVGTITGTAVKLTGTPMTTTDDPTSPVTPYTQAPATAPASGIPSD